MESKKINQLATEMSPAASDLTIIGDPITGVSKKITLEQISSLFAGSVSFYTNLASFPVTGVVDTIYCAKDTNKLYLWSGSAYVEVFPSQALLNTYQLRSEKGSNNGYASLDSGGKVPSNQLPSYVDDIIEVANYAALPVTGETGKIYITLDNNKVYRWTGSIYVEIAANNAIWGSITGTLSNQTDLQNALNAKVPYTGATANVDLGTFDLTTDIINLNQLKAIGSGGLNIYSNSGTHIALMGGGGGAGTTFYGGIIGTSISLSSTLTASSLIKTGGTSSQFLKADGSVDTSAYITLTSLSAGAGISYNNTTGVIASTITQYTDALARAALSFTAGSGGYNSTTGVITIPTNTSQLTNGANYITLASLSSSATGLTYTNTTGVFSLTAGYSIPTTASQGNWNTAYNDSIVSAAVTGTTTKTLTLTQQDAGTITASWTDINTDAVTSVFGRTGVVVATSGDYNTSQVTELTNLYFTDARSRAALSFTAGSGAYNSTSGVITIPTNNNQITNGSNYITLTSLSGSTGISYNNTTGAISSTITQYTDALARASISLTTTGTSGAATYNSTTGVFNIPNYAPNLSGYVPYTGATTNVALGSNTLQVNEKIGTADNKGIYLRGISDSTHKIYYNTTGGNAIWEYNTSIFYQFYNTGSPVTRFTFATNGDFTAVGNILGANLSGTNTGDQTLAGLGGVPTSRTLTINGTAFDLSADRSWTITAGVTGSGTATRVAFWDSTGSITSSSGFYWDNIAGRVAIGKNSADTRLEVYAGTKGQIRCNGGSAMGAGLDLYTELSGADRRNWAIFTENTNSGDLEIIRSASAGASATLQTLSCNKDGEVSVYSYFNIINADQTAMYFNNTGRAGGGGRKWGILNGNLGAGEFSIKDETSGNTRFRIGGDGIATTYVSASIGIATDAVNFMRISENQIWRTSGALYINNSGSGQVIIAGGGGAITLGTDTQVGSNFITTKNMGITGSNTYFGTGQVRIGGGADHTTNVVLSVAPGVVQFDRPGVAGGAFKINSDGTSTFGKTVTISAGTLEAFAFGVNQTSTFAFGSTNGRRAAIIAHETIGDSGLQFGWDTTDKTGIIAGSANSTGAGIDFYTFNGSAWANRMRLTKDGSFGIGTNSPAVKLSVLQTGSVISSGTVTFASQAKGIEIYNDGGSTTDNLAGLWFSTGPHKAGIASGRTNAASTWGVDLRFFVHGPEIANLDETYEKMRLLDTGNLLINTRSENSYGGNARSIQIDGSGSLLETRYSGTSAVRVGSGSDHSYLHDPRNVEMRFATFDSTRFYIYGNGNYSFTGSNVSDRRAKDNIATLELTATDKIMQLEAKSYNMKNNPSQKRYGFIAQDVKEVIADLVSGNDTDGYLGLDYDGLLTIAIKAIQEQQKQIEILKQKIYEN
jgi:hypothetical protein